MRSTIKAYKTPCISKEDIQKVVHAISAANITTEESKESHVRNIQITLQNRELAIANRKCPKCGGNILLTG